ncbi:hypothetical protein PG994_008648 [Apiospora phragmitis]|uniref:Uncharacterized protein n=1 Tax=Apiospora phragmitis TaxID=2905665 RepID=A0ABR1UH22_9PEZI
MQMSDEMPKQQQPEPQAAGGLHPAHNITAAAMPSKVFNGEAWLLDPYGTGNNPLSSSDFRNRGKTPASGGAKGGSSLRRDAGKGGKQSTEAKASGSGSASGNILDQYGEMDTSHAGRASLASDGDIELPAEHELVHDRFGSPGADDLGI